MSLFTCYPLPQMPLFVTNFGYPLPFTPVTSFLTDPYVEVFGRFLYFPAMLFFCLSHSRGLGAQYSFFNSQKNFRVRWRNHCSKNKQICESSLQSTHDKYDLNIRIHIICYSINFFLVSHFNGLLYFTVKRFTVSFSFLDDCKRWKTHTNYYINWIFSSFISSGFSFLLGFLGN